jgi:hypothetical protein
MKIRVMSYVATDGIARTRAVIDMYLAQHRRSEKHPGKGHKPPDRAAPDVAEDMASSRRKRVRPDVPAHDAVEDRPSAAKKRKAAAAPAQSSSSGRSKRSRREHEAGSHLCCVCFY